MANGSKVIVPRVLVNNPGAEAHNSTSKLIKAVDDVDTSCSGSAVFKAVTSCVTSLKKLVDATVPLKANVALVTSLDDQRSTALAARPAMIASVKTAWHGFVSDVTVEGQTNPALVKATNLPIRKAAVRLAPDAELGIPEGVNVKKQKSGAWLYSWLAVLGAAGYQAQMAPAPAAGADPVWTLLTGEGVSRKLPPLVPDQHYLFRVTALSSDGRASAPSATVDFQAPPKK